MQETTIVACSTPPGKGGISVVRISGPLVQNIAQTVVRQIPKPRVATFCPFIDPQGYCLDEGIALFFPGPNSFTGEDMLELQGHGSPIAVDHLLTTLIDLGAQLAEPGEFSKRAFLNGKTDLIKIEATADLIESASKQAALSAARSLTGQFSTAIQALVKLIKHLRVDIEAHIDFSDQDIEITDLENLKKRGADITSNLQNLLDQAQQGCLLQEGIKIVIAGLPNAGKSSLLNALAGYEAAIVTAIPGTTRDPIREHITLDGLPLHIIDTAGLRESDHPVEQIGIQRTKTNMQQANGILWVFDITQSTDAPCKLPEVLNTLSPKPWVAYVGNKIDLRAKLPHQSPNTVFLSAKTGKGLAALIHLIKKKAGYQDSEGSIFMARRRHLTALKHSLSAIETGYELLCHQGGYELIAEQLRQAQYQLSMITGEEISADHLLGEIFSKLCIGK